MQEETKRSFIEELQALNEPTKRKVLIGATVVIMLIVAYLWLGYFNGLIAASSQAPVAAAQPTTAEEQQPQVQQPQADVAPPPALGVWQNVEQGMATIGGFFAGAFASFAHLVRIPGQYNISPSK